MQGSWAILGQKRCSGGWTQGDRAPVKKRKRINVLPLHVNPATCSTTTVIPRVHGQPIPLKIKKKWLPCNLFLAHASRSVSPIKNQPRRSCHLPLSRAEKQHEHAAPFKGKDQGIEVGAQEKWQVKQCRRRIGIQNYIFFVRALRISTTYERGSPTSYILRLFVIPLK